MVDKNRQIEKWLIIKQIDRKKIVDNKVDRRMIDKNRQIEKIVDKKQIDRKNG